MKGYVDTTGLERLTARLRSVASHGLDATDLMKTFQTIIEADNRKGVLAGLDKDGRPMAPVTYRPVGKAAKLTASQRNTSNARARKGAFAGRGPLASGLHGNLASAEYRRLGGPPLAPRKAFSRVITNLRTHHVQVSPHTWEAYGFWYEVVDVKGRPFLHHLFKRRDLRGVRPEGRAKARKAAVAWMSDRIRRLSRPQYAA